MTDILQTKFNILQAGIQVSPETASLDEILATATKIENWLVGDTTPPPNFIRTLADTKIPSQTSTQRVSINPLQYLMAAHIVNNKHSIISSEMRQCGMTTLLILYALWYAQNNKNVNVLYITDTVTSSANARDIVYVHTTSGDLQKFDKDEIGFCNKSTIRFMTYDTSKLYTLRGNTIHLLILDNTAYMSYAIIEEFLSIVGPLFSKSCQNIIASYKEDNIGYFTQMWEKDRNFTSLNLTNSILSR